jgi:hypothetical protein
VIAYIPHAANVTLAALVPEGPSFVAVPLNAMVAVPEIPVKTETPCCK